MKRPTKAAIKAAFGYLGTAILFLVRNWKIVTITVGLISTSAAAIMGKLEPLATAIGSAVPV